jgi:hypothetical protein
LLLLARILSGQEKAEGRSAQLASAIAYAEGEGWLANIPTRKGWVSLTPADEVVVAKAKMIQVGQWLASGIGEFRSQIIFHPDKSSPRCACANYEAARASDFSPRRPRAGEFGMVSRGSPHEMIELGACDGPYAKLPALLPRGVNARQRAATHPCA